MDKNNTLNFIKNVLDHMPADWLKLTTHRLDIYNEEQAKYQFLEEFEKLSKAESDQLDHLSELPTAYDYIRLGHPLSCVLEWTIAQLYDTNADHVISFSSQTMPVMAVLRKNLLENKQTQILYSGDLPTSFDADTIRKVYGYRFDLKKVNDTEAIVPFDGSTVFIANQEDVSNFNLSENVDFHVNINKQLGSVILINSDQNSEYVSEIQHVRRRESIAMTPSDTVIALNRLLGQESDGNTQVDVETNKSIVSIAIKEITGTQGEPLLGSSGLSVQYAIMMGLIEDAIENHPDKAIKIIIPPNCYGGTNDQARRVAACSDQIEVVDLPVDDGQDMVQSVDKVLNQVAAENAIPYIIVEIPTNPRVEVPDLEQLRATLTKERKTASGETAIDPVFILDQTFCPNVHFLGEGEILADVRSIAYVSGSKFPSGGKCTAGFCVANDKAAPLMEKIASHFSICDNEATVDQMAFLAEQLPSMNQRIAGAYQNTREFVNFISEKLPDAKINFVSEELASQGFTPSVFSLDLPTKGTTDEEKETYKRALNLKLINLMIGEIPVESKYCVSYGQLKGCYWTIPATSTQGTTKEGDKDYIVRVALSANMDLDRHKEVFSRFVDSI
ncbi:MAG: cystathionine beta-synthase [Bacteroidota bacterium]